jgi:hypothetical protein
LSVGWVVQGVAQRPWGVEEDLALLMHFLVPNCMAELLS